MMIRKTVNLQSSAQQILKEKERIRLSQTKGIRTKNEQPVLQVNQRKDSNEKLFHLRAIPVNLDNPIDISQRGSDKNLNGDGGIDSVDISCVEFDPRESKFSMNNPFNPEFNEEEKSRIFENTEKFSRIDAYESK